MVSGLDSIALAVAHLEKTENTTNTSTSQDGLSHNKASDPNNQVPGLPFPQPSSARTVSSSDFECGGGTPSTYSMGSSAGEQRTVGPFNRQLELAPFRRTSGSVASPGSHNGFLAPSHHYVSPGPQPTAIESSTVMANSHFSSGSNKGVLDVATVLSSDLCGNSSSTRGSSDLEKNLKNLESVFEPADFNAPNCPRAPDPKDIFTSIEDDDVLCGRGGESNHHKGNIQYRRLVKSCQPAYLTAKRRDKPRIAAGIVLAVRKVGGRFLKKEATFNLWRDVGNIRAREKTSQALREGAPELRTATENVASKRATSSSYHNLHHSSIQHMHGSNALHTARQHANLLAGSHCGSTTQSHDQSRGPILVPPTGRGSMIIPNSVGNMMDSRALMMNSHRGSAIPAPYSSHSARQSVPHVPSSTFGLGGYYGPARLADQPPMKKAKGLVVHEYSAIDGTSIRRNHDKQELGKQELGTGGLASKSKNATSKVLEPVLSTRCVATISGDEDSSSSSSMASGPLPKVARTSGPRLKNLLKRRLEERD